MQLTIHHATEYSFESAVEYGVKQLRLRPQNSSAQSVIDWDVQLIGARFECQFDDFHGNRVDLITLDRDTDKITISCSGKVQTNDTAGVSGWPRTRRPDWLYLSETPLTQMGKSLTEFAKSFERLKDPIENMHALASAIRGRVDYEVGVTAVDTVAEDAFAAGHGVCQDHTHIFLALARHMGLPARYVSGYLMMNETVEQDASHAWAEVLIDSLGWVGFDISNGIAPDERYVSIAVGREYSEAAPISGVHFGSPTESMLVNVQVQQ